MDAAIKKGAVGVALSRAWETFKANPGIVIANTILLGLVVVLVVVLVHVPLFLIGIYAKSKFFLPVVVALLMPPVLYGGYIKSMIELARGRSVAIGDFIMIGLGRFFGLIGLALFKSIVLFFGFILFIIPGIYLMVRWSFAEYALIDENLSIGQAFERSSALVKGQWWDVFVLSLICSIIGGLLSITIIGGLIAVPFVALVYAHYYIAAQS